MTVLQAKSALLPNGWAQDVTVQIGADGRIASLAQAPGDQPADHHVDILLAAPGNVHSHAFQRAMAGLTERRGSGDQDTFWTWRQLMYRFMDHLTPEDVQAIAAQVQMESLETGFAAIGEFHYLHHQRDGSPYNDLAEMAGRIAAAAAQTGIGLTLLPVLYQQGGPDGRALGAGQIRFGNNPERYFDLLAASGACLTTLPADTGMGAAPHSLRAVSPDALRDVARHAGGPLHMHIAEQQDEVDDIQAAYGARPVRWALDNLPLDSRWCLIHCTRMQPSETKGLSDTGVVAGLCPITEASLGDGIFDGVRWVKAGGAMALGSDSNIRISLAEELRQLEYSQRLRDNTRATLADPGASTGRTLYDAVLAGGAQALGRNSGAIAPGQWADLLALEGDAPDLIGRQGDTVLDTWIFAAGDTLIRDVWSAGRHMVQGGRHIAREAITAQYRACLTRLAGAM